MSEALDHKKYEKEKRYDAYQKMVWSTNSKNTPEHLCVGLIGEVAERFLITSNRELEEELGDILWHLMFATESDMEWDKVMKAVLIEDMIFPDPRDDHEVYDWIDLISVIADYYKRRYIYDLPGYTDITMREGILVPALKFIQRDCQSNGITLDELMDSNTYKLAQRYPNGYWDKQSAIERKDKVED